MLDLDSAIKHCEEVAEAQISRADALDDIPMFGSSEEDKKLIDSCYQCADEHRQLARWLKELKTLRHYIVTELEISCASSDDIFDEDDERYYVLEKLNSMIAVADRYPNYLKK